MKDSTHTLIYSLVLGLVCSLLLTGVAEVTRPHADSNRAAERIRHVFGVLGVEYDEDLPSKELVALYDKYEADKTITEGKIGDLPLYVYAPAGAEASKQTKAVEFSGRGRNGIIKGFLALDMEMTTIRGITFHVQLETPGLGGEITTKEFRDRFVGKKLEDAGGQPVIRIVKNGTAREGTNEVDGISSATMTCKKVQAMLNSAIRKIIEERNSNGR